MSFGIGLITAVILLSIPAILILRAAFGLGALIFRNLTRNRRRSILTLASSAISLGLLTLIVSMYQSFFYGDDASPSEARRIVTRHKISLIQPLPISHQDKIAKVAGIQKISPYSWFQGTYINEKNFFARFAVDPETIFDIYQDWDMPADQLKEFKNRSHPNACVVSNSIAKQFDFHPGQHIQIVGDIYPVTLELDIVGIFNAPDASQCLAFNRTYLKNLLEAKSPNDPQKDMVGTFIMIVEDPAKVPRISKQIDDMFAEDAAAPTRTESEKEFGRSFLAFLGNIKLFLAAICGAVTFTILLVSANAVAMAVRERTREVAILRTLGYRPGEVLQLILGESILVSFIGGIFGLGIGMLLSWLMQKMGAFFGFQGLKWQGAVIVMAASIVVGLVSALPPALVAARKNVVESLRFTG